MRLSGLSSRFEQRSRIERIWERYVQGDLEPTGLRDEIAQSWRRARDSYRLDPALTYPRHLLSPEALVEMRRRDEVLELALPILHNFEGQLSSHVVAYMDRDGWLLFVGGDEDIHAQVDKIHFRPGVNWSEEFAGTNGPGTALASGSPVEVFACEHFVSAWQPWFCAAAPILAPGDSAPVGVVDVTGPWHKQSGQAMNVAQVIVRAIQQRLGAIQNFRDEVVRHALRAAREAGDALVAVDARGRVIATNDAASRRAILKGGAIPAEVREALADFLEGSPPGAEGETTFALRDGPALIASAVLHCGSTVGAILRVPGRRRERPVRGGPRPSTRYDFSCILGRSVALRGAVAQGSIAASNGLPVVLYGESGTGKELFAQAIHAASGLGGPFIAVNCGSIPAALVEAELFGYEAGSFTGARRGGSPGRFEDADGGTLFLDEVSELPPPAQTALLRLLQEKEVVRLGGSTPRRVEVRVIAATNKPLDEELRAKRFRHDLYYRLNVLPISLPPLRDRGDDVCELGQVILDEAAQELGRGDLTLTSDALDALRAYRWPGNVRELRNVILRAAATAVSPRIKAEDLHFDDSVEPSEAVVAQPCAAAADCVGASTEGETATGAATGTLRETVLASERARLVEALRACEWNFVRTAKHLGISRSTLYRLLHKYELSRATIPR
jgi:transcriptional regulator of acetoin/glycerol metabolism